MAELGRRRDIDLFHRPPQQHESQLTGNGPVRTLATQMVGQQSNGARILTDQLATAGRGKEEDVAIIIEVAESVVDKVTGCEVVGEKVIAWKAGVA